MSQQDSAPPRSPNSRPGAPSPFLVAADLIDPPAGPLDRYRHDAAAFVEECVRWRVGEGPTFYQRRVLEALVERDRVAERGPHGYGKTAGKALALLWFALTRDAAGIDWKVITTASAWRQLIHYLWPEVHKWARRLDWERIGRPPFNERTEMLSLSLQLRHGEAFAVASNDHEKIEGAHADALLYIFDEAKSIPAETFDAAEGAFAGTGEIFALVSSTPGDPNGRFYDIHARRAGLEDWHTVHVSLEDGIKAGRISAEWAEQRKHQWGETSAVYLNRVRGEFAASDEDSTIPLAWVEAANERWLDAHGPGCSSEYHQPECVPGAPFRCVGVDVARSGADRTVLGLRYGDEIRELRRLPRQDTMATTGHVSGVLDALGGYASVDVIGIGAGVVDRLREQRCRVAAFNASEGTKRRDRSGELGFVNVRSAAWWNVREILDPASGVPVALPPDDRLTGDLTAPKWRVMSGGRIQIESKDDIRKRLGRSTDDGDAVVQAFWVAHSEPGSAYDVIASMRGPSRR